MSGRPLREYSPLISLSGQGFRIGIPAVEDGGEDESRIETRVTAGLLDSSLEGIVLDVGVGSQA